MLKAWQRNLAIIVMASAYHAPAIKRIANGDNHGSQRWQIMQRR